MALLLRQVAMKTKTLCAIFSFIVVLSGVTAWGSGSYSAPSYPSSPPATRPPENDQPVAIDRERYHLGQKIFAGKIELPEEIISEEVTKSQTEALTKFKKELPEDVAKEFKIEGLAGYLDEKQFVSLQYYLYIRYIHTAQTRKS